MYLANRQNSGLKSLNIKYGKFRGVALKLVFTNFETVFDTLKEIAENHTNFRAKVSSLFSNICSLEFLFCLVFLYEVMEYINVLSKHF